MALAKGNRAACPTPPFFYEHSSMKKGGDAEPLSSFPRLLRSRLTAEAQKPVFYEPRRRANNAGRPLPSEARQRWTRAKAQKGDTVAKQIFR